MTGALLTALLFSLSVILANRSIAALGTLHANLDRLTLAGFVLIVLWFPIQTLIASRRHRHIRCTDTSAPTRTWRSYTWIPLNAFSGPILGVSCYQWALATTASGIVLPIVACTPLVIIPFSYWLEGERPTQRSVLGALLAVTGVIALSGNR